MTTKGCLITGFIGLNVVFWGVTLAVNAFLQNGDLASVLAVAALVELLALLLGWTAYMVWFIFDAIRDLQRLVAPVDFLLSAIWGPFAGILLNLTYFHADPEADFYTAVVGAGASLLIAYTIDAGLPNANPDLSARSRRGIVVGAATGITVAIAAPLVALARDAGGSRALCGLAIGGVLEAVLLLLLTLGVRASASVAGPLGEHQVVGGGEGGREGA